MTTMKSDPVVRPRRSTRRAIKPRRYTPPTISPIKVTPPKIRVNKKGRTHPPCYLPPILPAKSHKGTSDVYDGRLNRYGGMLWLDDKHVIRPGVEMARTAPTVRELMGTWRWVWRTGHGEISVDGWQGGIRFRMAGDNGWSSNNLIGRMRYDPRGLRPAAAKDVILGCVKKSDALHITIDMSDNYLKQDHADISNIPATLRFTQQPGPTDENLMPYPVKRLLCLTYVDPDEGEVEIFGMKQPELGSLDGPRGYPAPPVRTDDDMFEEMNPLFGDNEVPEGLFREFGIGVSKKGLEWHDWLYRKGMQKGWYQIDKDWPPAPPMERRAVYGPTFCV